ncbi:hypothetical protein [Dietzia sp. PP-33]|uniref:hypothetical protein n=1 Tax=Dietzia sp. PP-33 TaxID=2957500 RepID=UPI0029A8F20F|nr:hypothetical protein [Dietzia sp. PP-33]MDX2358004.1 hypothetical protein [Dietzia sp. PP-33]
MRRVIASATTPGRWRRRRAARIALAGALVLAAPFAGHPDGHDVPASPSDARHSPDHGHRDPGPATHSRVRVVPVPLADPAVADLLQPGDLVDLVGTADPASPTGPAVVARAARVTGSPAGRAGSRSILVEVPESDAARLASTAAGTPLAVLVHG